MFFMCDLQSNLSYISIYYYNTELSDCAESALTAIN